MYIVKHGSFGNITVVSGNTHTEIADAIIEAVDLATKALITHYGTKTVRTANISATKCFLKSEVEHGRRYDVRATHDNSVAQYIFGVYEINTIGTTD